MKHRKAIIFFLIIILFFLVSGEALAAQWWPLVQCGLKPGPDIPEEFTRPCTQCDLIKLAKNLIDFVLVFIVPVVGTLLIFIAGFLILLGGANPNLVSRGKDILSSTIIGIVIIASSWMIVNFVLKSLAGDSDISTRWYQIQCEAEIRTIHGVSGENGENGEEEPTPTHIFSPENGEVLACMFSLEDLCEPDPMVCSNTSCGQYVSTINQYAGGAASVNLLKAIMIKESSCQVNSTSPDGSSYGLMQLQPSTANMYKQYCDVTENITSGWLLNPNNAEASICIAAEFIRRGLGPSACGGSVRTLAAGYNGGSGACGLSVDCANEVSCSGDRVQRWECPYDNPEQTVCNGGDDVWAGYNQTRDYVRKVLYCYNNPGF